MENEFSEMMNRLSEDARFALQKADLFSKKYNNGYMGTEHILLGVLAQDASEGAKLLAKFDVDLAKAEKALGQEAAEVNGGAAMAMMSLSESAVLTLRMADHYATERGARTVGTEHILYALLCQPSSRGTVLLDKMEVDLQGLTEVVEKELDARAENERA